MTIIVAVKTGSELVISADSKITVRSVSGRDVNGLYTWSDQTYDYGTKIASSRYDEWVDAVAGQVTFGNTPVLDIIRESQPGIGSDAAEQDQILNVIVTNLVKIREDAWRKYMPNPLDWPITQVLLASPNSELRGVRAWRVDFIADQFRVEEILQVPGIEVMGSTRYTSMLMYGYDPTNQSTM